MPRGRGLSVHDDPTGLLIGRYGVGRLFPGVGLVAGAQIPVPVALVRLELAAREAAATPG